MTAEKSTKKGIRPTIEVMGEALGARREVSVAELAEATGLGQSTVAKTLATFEANGTATRTPGGRDGGRRLPDRWSPITTANNATEVAKRAADAPIAAEHGNGGPKATSATRERLGKGGLGDLVLAHLAASPDEDHGPVAIAKALGGRSSGAVGNALQRLSDSGRAVLTSASPRRYRFAKGAPGDNAPQAATGNGRVRAAKGAKRAAATRGVGANAGAK